MGVCDNGSVSGVVYCRSCVHGDNPQVGRKEMNGFLKRHSADELAVYLVSGVKLVGKVTAIHEDGLELNGKTFVAKYSIASIVVI